MSEPESLRIVLFPEAEDLWVGIFLEYYIAAQGKTWQEALSQTKLAIVEQAHLDDHSETAPLSNCPPTPEDVVERFDHPQAELLSAELVDSIPVNATGRFVDRYLGNLTVKRLDIAGI